MFTAISLFGFSACLLVGRFFSSLPLAVRVQRAGVTAERALDEAEQGPEFLPVDPHDIAARLVHDLTPFVAKAVSGDEDTRPRHQPRSWQYLDSLRGRQPVGMIVCGYVTDHMHKRRGNLFFTYLAPAIGLLVAGLLANPVIMFDTGGSIATRLPRRSRVKASAM